MSTEQDRVRLATRVIQERRAKFGTVEAAIRAARVNRATWQRVEDGAKVRDDKLGAIEKALGWQPGDAWRVMGGLEPLADAPAESAVRHGGVRESVLNDQTLTEPIRRAIFALLDASEPPAAKEVGDDGRSAAM